MLSRISESEGLWVQGDLTDFPGPRPQAYYLWGEGEGLPRQEAGRNTSREVWLYLSLQR